MREIYRDIASALIFSRDGKLLMGKKHVGKGGSYEHYWHIPGGGVDEDETMIDALIREVQEETGLDITELELKFVQQIDSASAEKLDKATGEQVLAHMKFHRFEVWLPYDADEVVCPESEEFAEFRWYSRDELPYVEQIPGGREFFIKQGYMDDVARELRKGEKFL